jgi:hypothetical protein
MAKNHRVMAMSLATPLHAANMWLRAEKMAARPWLARSHAFRNCLHGRARALSNLESEMSGHLIGRPLQAYEARASANARLQPEGNVQDFPTGLPRDIGVPSPGVSADSVVGDRKRE